MKNKSVIFLSIGIISLILLLVCFSYSGSVFRVNNSENLVFLTFDDGPSENTLEVLKILEEKNVSATFFLIGENIQMYPKIVDSIIEQNHTIGIHSMTHPVLVSNVFSEIDGVSEILKDDYNYDSNLFRPPYGFSTPVVNLYVHMNNMKMIMYGVFPRDYKSSSEVILKRIDRNVRRGSVIVLHDAPGNRSSMIESLPSVIDIVRDKGYEFGRIEDYVD